jgi:6-phosphogluconolactonase
MEATRMVEIQRYRNSASLVEAAAEHVVRVADEAIANRGRFKIALASDATLHALYRLLATDSFARRIEWTRVEVFFCDERCIPVSHSFCNYRAVREELLERVPLPPDNVHRIRGEREPTHAADEYELVLRRLLKPGATRARRESFDLTLLDLGRDGHTASLFPGLSALRETGRWVLAEEVEAVWMWRITLTPAVINASRAVTFVVAGDDKAEALTGVVAGLDQPDVLPAQAIRPSDGRLLWMVDEAAAGQLRKDTLPATA